MGPGGQGLGDGGCWDLGPGGRGLGAGYGALEAGGWGLVVGCVGGLFPAGQISIVYMQRSQRHISSKIVPRLAREGTIIA